MHRIIAIRYLSYLFFFYIERVLIVIAFISFLNDVQCNVYSDYLCKVTANNLNKSGIHLIWQFLKVINTLERAIQIANVSLKLWLPFHKLDQRFILF